MLYIIILLFLLINSNQETIWFGIQSTKIDQPISLFTFDEATAFEVINSANIALSHLSYEIIKVFITECWTSLNYGLSLTDIERALFFILFIRFIVIGIRYNLKTSFYITSIGLAAGTLWYRHLIDIISIYSNTLLNIPFLENLGLDAFRLQKYYYQIAMSDKPLALVKDIHWYNIGQLLYYGFKKSLITINPETGLKHYVDPLSMVVSNLDESTQAKIVPLYYKVYNQILPRVFFACSKFWNQLSGIVAYVLITRIGKRYCPYLIRWHWTFLLIVSIIEPFIESFVFRAQFFEEFVLIPKLTLAILDIGKGQLNQTTSLLGIYNENVPNLTNNVYENILFQMNSLNIFISMTITSHISFILFALFHSICGQYFYFPFFTENVELHVGLRPKNSVYSGGYTSWQETTEKEPNLNRLYPKIWYGWLGRGTKKNGGFLSFIKDSILKFFT